MIPGVVKHIIEWRKWLLTVLALHVSAVMVFALPPDSLPLPSTQSRIEKTASGFILHYNTPGLFADSITIDTLANMVKLNHQYVYPASIRLVNSGGDSLKPAEEFEYDAGESVISLKKKIAGRKLFVQYNFVQQDFPGSLALRDLKAAREADTLVTNETVSLIERVRTKQENDPFFSSDLSRSGYITRGIQIGTDRDISMESGLKLSLEGKLAENIEIRALLDDRNLPIQPEGTSRRLEEIDKVYVEMQAGGLNGRFGDYILDLNSGRYGKINRRLEGGKLEQQYRGIGAKAAGAVTKAQFYSNSFSGIDGIQGPYRLHGKNGEENLVIQGGSEKVWVDGIERQRGETGDYIIDYNRGEVTFMPGLPITSESRIEIDFEYSADIFPRNVYASELDFSLASAKVKGSFLFFQEGDDEEQPINFEMTPETRNILRQSGDTVGLIQVPSADSLGPGEGDYTRIDTVWTDGNTYSAFRFIPPADNGDPLGEWRVVFSELADESGDYQRIYDPVYGTYTYEWIGPGLGDYAPVRLVPPPSRHRIGVFALQSNPYDNISLTADIALSDQDLNTLSNVNDSDNSGVAQAYTARFQWPGEAPNVPLEVLLNYRSEESQFREVARTRDIEFERKWGADSLLEQSAERETGLRMISRPVKGAEFSGAYGKLDQENILLSERFEGSGSFNTNKMILNGFVEQINSENSLSNETSEWLRSRGAASYRLGIWQPGISGEYEQRDAGIQDTVFSGHRYSRLKGIWGLTEWMGHSGEAALEYRTKDKQQASNSYRELYQELGTALKWNYSPADIPWRSEVEVNHREKTYTNADSSSFTSDLASIRSRFLPYKGALSIDTEYRLSRTVSQQTALIAYQVPVGQGDYIRIDGEYVYDPDFGEYILRSEPTGDAEPTTDLTAAMNVDWSPHRLPGGVGKKEGFGWEDISTATILEVREVTRWEKASDIYLLNLSSFQSDSTVDGRMGWTQDVYLFRTSRDFNLRLRYEAAKRISSYYQAGRDRYGEDAWELRSRIALNKNLDMENVGEYSRIGKKTAFSGGNRWFRKYRGGTQATWRVSRLWRITGALRGIRDEDLSQPDPVYGVAVKPGLIYAVRGKGRISADFEAFWVTSAMEEIPFELADGRPKGRNGRGNIRIDYKIGTYLTTRGSYSLRLDDGRNPVHLARMELSASF